MYVTITFFFIKMNIECIPEKHIENLTEGILFSNVKQKYKSKHRMNKNI